MSTPTPPRYRCPECGWEGTEAEMQADYSGEMWSNHICPSCGLWWRLEDYEPLATPSDAP